MKQEIYIHWFRQDLRISDNPALTFAAKCALYDNTPLLALYICDDDKRQAKASASNVWKYHSLKALDKSLGGKLHFYKGDAHAVIYDSLMQQFQIKGIFANRSYDPRHIKRDAQIESDLKQKGIEFKTFNGALLWEPEDTLKQDGTPYKVFTHFYKKACLSLAPPPRAIVQTPALTNLFPKNEYSLKIDDLELLSGFSWEDSLKSCWQIGEQGAQNRLNAFINEGLQGYERGRDYPALNNVSRLSAHLHCGEISPNQIWHALEGLGDDTNSDLRTFRKQLGWREFSYSLLYHNRELAHKNLQSKFDNFPWMDNPAHLKAWQTGKTGYPIIDAGMRELWQTGYMHNRVRMLTGSFLVKNLMLHWKHGFDWFWDCLCDADLANNAASWQWVAGCGTDAAPYFRIFNPLTQSKKFDPQGDYIKRYVSELKDIPAKHIHEPWEYAKDYPKPIIDLKISRERALKAFKSLS